MSIRLLHARRPASVQSGWPCAFILLVICHSASSGLANAPGCEWTCKGYREGPGYASGVICMRIARYCDRGDDRAADHALRLDSTETRWIATSCKVSTYSKSSVSMQRNAFPTTAYPRYTAAVLGNVASTCIKGSSTQMASRCCRHRTPASMLWRTGLSLRGGAAEEEMERFEDLQTVHLHAAEVGRDIADLKRSIASVFSRSGRMDGSTGVERRGGGASDEVVAGRVEGRGDLDRESYFLVTPSFLQKLASRQESTSDRLLGLELAREERRTLRNRCSELQRLQQQLRQEGGSPGVADEGEWISEVDPDSGCKYYWHSITKESRWTVPDSQDDEEAGEVEEGEEGQEERRWRAAVEAREGGSEDEEALEEVETGPPVAARKLSPADGHQQQTIALPEAGNVSPRYHESVARRASRSGAGEGGRKQWRHARRTGNAGKRTSGSEGQETLRRRVTSLKQTLLCRRELWRELHAMLHVAVVQAGLLLEQRQSLEHGVVAAEVRLQDLSSRLAALSLASPSKISLFGGNETAREVADHPAVRMLADELPALISRVRAIAALNASAMDAAAITRPPHRLGWQYFEADLFAELEILQAKIKARRLDAVAFSAGDLDCDGARGADECGSSTRRVRTTSHLLGGSLKDLVGLPTVCLQMATLEGTEGALRRLQSKYIALQKALADEQRGGGREWARLETGLKEGWGQAVADAAFAKEEAAELFVKAKEAEELARRQEFILSRAMLHVNSTIYRGPSRAEKLEGGRGGEAGTPPGPSSWDIEAKDIESFWKGASDDCVIFSGLLRKVDLVHAGANSTHASLTYGNGEGEMLQKWRQVYSLEWCVRAEMMDRPRRMLSEAQKFLASARRAVGVSVDDIRRFLISVRQERLWKDQARADRARERERAKTEAGEREEAAACLRQLQRVQERERRAAAADEEEKEWERKRRAEEEEDVARCEAWAREREEILAKLAQVEQKLELGRSEVRTLGEQLEEMRHGGEAVERRLQDAMSASNAEQARRQGVAHELVTEEMKRHAAVGGLQEALAGQRVQLAARKGEVGELEAEARELRISLEHITRARQAHAAARKSEIAQNELAASEALREEAREHRQEELRQEHEMKMDDDVLQRQLQQARQTQVQSAARGAEDRSGWRRAMGMRRERMRAQIGASQDLLRSTRADVEEAAQIEISLRRRLNDTELAEESLALCLRQQAAALAKERDTAKSRLMEMNATLCAAFATKARLEVEVEEMRSQEKEVVQEFEGMLQEEVDARSSGERALRDLTAKYEEDIANLRVNHSPEHEHLSVLLNESINALQQQDAELTAARAENASWSAREQASFEEVAKVRSLLESVANASARGTREDLLHVMEEKYAALQLAVAGSLRQGQTMLHQARELVGRSGEWRAEQRQLLQLRRRRAETRVHEVVERTAEAMGSIAGAQERVRMLRETEADLERQVAEEMEAVATAEKVAKETSRLEGELLAVRARRIERAVAAEVQGLEERDAASWRVDGAAVGARNAREDLPTESSSNEREERQGKGGDGRGGLPQMDSRHHGGYRPVIPSEGVEGDDGVEAPLGGGPVGFKVYSQTANLPWEQGARAGRVRDKGSRRGNDDGLDVSISGTARDSDREGSRFVPAAEEDDVHQQGGDAEALLARRGNGKVRSEQPETKETYLATKRDLSSAGMVRSEEPETVSSARQASEGPQGGWIKHLIPFL